MYKLCRIYLIHTFSTFFAYNFTLEVGRLTVFPKRPESRNKNCRFQQKSSGAAHIQARLFAFIFGLEKHKI